MPEFFYHPAASLYFRVPKTFYNENKDHLIAAPDSSVHSAGCVYSLYPLYTEDDLVYETRLEGVYSEPGSKEVWKFENMLGHELGFYDGKAEYENQKKVKETVINKKNIPVDLYRKRRTPENAGQSGQMDDNLF